MIVPSGMATSKRHARDSERAGDQRHDAVARVGEQRRPHRVGQEFPDRHVLEEERRFPHQDDDDGHRGEHRHQRARQQDQFNDPVAVLAVSQGRKRPFPMATGRVGALAVMRLPRYGACTALNQFFRRERAGILRPRPGPVAGNASEFTFQRLQLFDRDADLGVPAEHGTELAGLEMLPGQVIGTLGQRQVADFADQLAVLHHELHEFAHFGTLGRGVADVDE